MQGSRKPCFPSDLIWALGNSIGSPKKLGLVETLGSTVLMFHLQPPLSGAKGDVLGLAPWAPTWSFSCCK